MNRQVIAWVLLLVCCVVFVYGFAISNKPQMIIIKAQNISPDMIKRNITPAGCMIIDGKASGSRCKELDL